MNKSPIRVNISPRKFKFSQINKLIKLIDKDQLYITSHNKNPLINFQIKDWKRQKPQISLGSKISLKCMKKCMNNENKWKRRGKRVLPALEDKNLAKSLRENDKKLIGSLDRREREKCFWNSLYVIEHAKTQSFKKLSMWFSIDRKLDSIDRKCLQLIQQWSKWADSNQFFNRNFDQSSNRFDRSKI